MPNPKLSPELRLLLRFCRPEWGMLERGELAQLVAHCDPDRLINTIERHRLAPLVHQRCRSLPEGNPLPQAVQSHLAARTQENLAQALVTLGLFAQLQARTAQEQIDLLPLKGVTMACIYQGNPGLRHSYDLDLMADLAHAPRLRQIMAELGFHSDPSEFPWTLLEAGPNHRAFLLKNCKNETFHADSGQTVEIHWRLRDSTTVLPLDMPALQALTLPYQYQDIPFRLMEPVLLLLYLCHHGSEHAWFRLKWLVDIPLLLSRHTWDWPLVLAEARRQGCYASLLLGLRLSEIHGGWSPPAVVQQAFHRQPRLTGQVKTVTTYLDEADTSIDQFSNWQHLRLRLFQCTLADSPRQLWSELSRYLLTYNDVAGLRIPDRFFFLYYPLRPLLFVWRRLLGRAR